MSRWAARPRRARRASCAPRARPMSCRTAMSCTSCIADGYPPACGSGSTGLERRQDRTWPLAARRAGVLQAREGGARLCHLRDFFVEGGDPLAREGADAGPIVAFPQREQVADFIEREASPLRRADEAQPTQVRRAIASHPAAPAVAAAARRGVHQAAALVIADRSEEHTSELQSLM